jgi:catechol 2,3-dioxygenase-like lactoylglutathione lyase family enzyme
MTNLDNPVLFLATANAERSRVFYERVLGLEFVADEPPALVFRVGDSTLRIQKVDHVHPAPYTALGWAVSDIRGAVRRLNGMGIRFERYEGMNQDGDGIWHAPSGALVGLVSRSGRPRAVADTIQMIGRYQWPNLSNPWT